MRVSEQVKKCHKREERDHLDKLCRLLSCNSSSLVVVLGWEVDHKDFNHALRATVHEVVHYRVKDSVLVSNDDIEWHLVREPVKESCQCLSREVSGEKPHPSRCQR